MLTQIPRQSLQLLMLLLTVRPGPGFALLFLGTSTSSVNQEFNSKPSTPVGPDPGHWHAPWRLTQAASALLGLGLNNPV